MPNSRIPAQVSPRAATIPHGPHSHSPSNVSGKRSIASRVFSRSRMSVRASASAKGPIAALANGSTISTASQPK